MNTATENGSSRETFHAAEQEDIAWIWQNVHQAIDELEFYNQEFKEFEKQRMSLNFLIALSEHNPFHLILLRLDGERAGFMISGPDNGVLFLYWSYVLPEFRKSRLVQLGNKFLLEKFDNGEFHKVSTFTRPENRTAVIVLKRFGWKESAHLENHIFGQDYKIFEYQFTKVSDGYRQFQVKGRSGQLLNKVKRLISKGN